MNVLLFGATGMVGQGALRECLLDPDVQSVLSVVRKATGQHHAKLKELVQGDFLDFSGIENHLSGLDACFFCLGVSSVGMTEQNYRRITYDITLAAATTLAQVNPSMTFIYVSGTGADSTQRGRSMWARVKGETENALLRLPFQAYMFRPGVIIPLHGIQAKNKATQMVYRMFGPLLPLLRALLPKYITTTEELGRAMLKVAKQGAPKRILEASDITAV